MILGDDGYHWFPVLEIETQSSISPGIYGHEAKEIDLGQIGAPAYLCPADITDTLRHRLIEITRRAARALNVYDVPVLTSGWAPAASLTCWRSIPYRDSIHP